MKYKSIVGKWWKVNESVVTKLEKVSDLEMAKQFKEKENRWKLQNDFSSVLLRKVKYRCKILTNYILFFL